MVRSECLRLRHADVHFVCRSETQTSQTRSSTWHEGRGRQRQMPQQASHGAASEAITMLCCAALLAWCHVRARGCARAPADVLRHVYVLL